MWKHYQHGTTLRKLLTVHNYLISIVGFNSYLFKVLGVSNEPDGNLGIILESKLLN